VIDAASKRPAPSPARAFFISVLCSSLGLGVLLLGDRGSSAWRRAQEESRTLKNQIAFLEAQNAALLARTRSAELSTHELEKIAREKLGLVKADEVVFVLPEEKSQSPNR
jgi:cell division protein FtsB